MKTFVSIAVLLLCCTSDAKAELKSYIISEGDPVFCSGGRFLLAAQKGRIIIRCESSTANAITLVGVKNASIIGIDFEFPESLESMAKRLEP